MGLDHRFGQAPQKSGRMKWLALVLVISTGFFFRKGIILLGVKAALSSAIGSGTGVEWSYEKIGWNLNSLEIIGFEWKKAEKQVRIDSCQAQLKFDWLHAKILAHVSIEHPQVLLASGAASEDSALFFPPLFSHPRLAVRWQMEHGVLQFPPSLPISRLFFSFTGADESDQLGTLTLSYEPNSIAEPLLTAAFFKQGGNLGYRFHVVERDCGQIVPLLPFLSSDPSLHWKDAEGKIAIDGQGALGPRLELLDFQCMVRGDNLSLCRGQQGQPSLIGKRQFGAANLEAEVSYHPTGEKKGFWEELVAKVEAQGGNWTVVGAEGRSDFSLEQVDLKCLLVPYADPEIEMKGSFVYQGKRGPFHLSGKGGVQLDGRYWMQTHVAMGSEEQGADGVISLCQPQEGSHVLHVELERADADYVNGMIQMAGGQAPELSYNGGTLRGKMLVEFFQGRCVRLTFDEIAAQNVAVDVPEKKMNFSAQMFNGSADLMRLDGGHWQIETGALALHGGECRIKGKSGLHLSGIEGDLSIIADELQPSTLIAQVGGLKGRINIHGTQAEQLLDTHWEGNASTLLGIPMQAAGFTSCYLDGALVKSSDGWDWIGECGIGAEVIQWGFHALGPTSFAELDHQGAFWTVSEGWVRSEKLTEATYAPFLQSLLPDGSLKGEIDLFGTFKDLRWNCSIQGDNLRFEHPQFALTIPQLGKKDPLLLDTEGRAVFCYDLNTRQLMGEIPVQEGKLSYKKSPICLNSLNGTVQIQDALVHDPDLNAVCHQLTIGADLSNLHIPLSDQTCFSDLSCSLHYDAHRNQMRIEKGQGKWTLADGKQYRVQLDHLEVELERSVRFDIRLLDTKKEIGRFNGQLGQNPFLGWDLDFDRESTHFYGTKLQMGKVVFREDGTLLFFEMHPIIKIQDLQKQLKFIFSSGLFASASFDEQDLEQLQLAGALDAEVKWEDQVLHFKAQGRDVLFKGQKIEEFKLIGKKEGERWIIDKVQADRLNGKARLDIDGKKLSFSHVEGSWNQLFWKGSGVYSHAEKQAAVVIDSLQGELRALADLAPQLALKLQGTFAVSARAKWDLASEAVQGECTAVLDLLQPIALRIKQDAPLSFSYVAGQGLQLQGMEPKLFAKNTMQYLGTLHADALVQEDQWDLHKLQFSFSPECIQRGIEAKLLSADWKSLYYESYLEGKGDLHGAADHLVFKGTLRDGRYGLKDSIYPLENIQIDYENARLQCQFKTVLNQQPLLGKLRVDLQGAPFGSLQISDKEHPKGIEAVFRSNGTKLCWDSIEGIACGIDVQLKAAKNASLPQATVMNGTIKIDGSRLDAFFSKEMQEKFKSLKLGKGYEFQGDLVLWQDPKKGFQVIGQLLGRQFELLGYQFDRLRAQIEATPEQIQVSKLAIDDEAGSFQMKKIAIDRRPTDHQWSFYIPLLQVKDLQPSLMKKIDNPSATIKPLMIRNLSLTEVRGNLSDARGWTGEGHLNFTNAFKKESTIFETPIEMIKNFGLDPGLLTPIQGEIDLELRGDKFYLVNMKNVFSEAKRSQFFLSPADQTSYIDLNGNIHIDILMRQDVVLKLTEAFTLIVRGTLDKPRYGLR